MTEPGGRELGTKELLRGGKSGATLGDLWIDQKPTGRRTVVVNVQGQALTIRLTAIDTEVQRMPSGYMMNVHVRAPPNLAAGSVG